MLRAFAPRTPYELAEASLGVLKQPVARQQPVRATQGFLARPGGGGIFLVLVILTRLSSWLRPRARQYCQVPRQTSSPICPKSHACDVVEHVPAVTCRESDPVRRTSFRLSDRFLAVALLGGTIRKVHGLLRLILPLKTRVCHAPDFPRSDHAPDIDKLFRY
jgi:hypothetical protein